MARARVTSKGQVTVPKSIRERLGVRPGDDLLFDIRGNRVIIAARHRQRVDELAGIFAANHALRDERTKAWTSETRRLVKTRRTRR
ncbi:MAG TPA: AbrB/MazE/SpoVT family DNA-binding domain-containing protein [bacterium]|nr:AbrB/MazE/SpoVT family DNA-binding domain-containing protein [bacterium]